MVVERLAQAEFFGKVWKRVFRVLTKIVLGSKFRGIEPLLTSQSVLHVFP
jgi:hypothetical protein